MITQIVSHEWLSELHSSVVLKIVPYKYGKEVLTNRTKGISTEFTRDTNSLRLSLTGQSLFTTPILADVYCSDEQSDSTTVSYNSSFVDAAKWHFVRTISFVEINFEKIDGIELKTESIFDVTPNTRYIRIDMKGFLRNPSNTSTPQINQPQNLSHSLPITPQPKKWKESPESTPASQRIWNISSIEGSAPATSSSVRRGELIGDISDISKKHVVAVHISPARALTPRPSNQNTTNRETSSDNPHSDFEQTTNTQNIVSSADVCCSNPQTLSSNFENSTSKRLTHNNDNELELLEKVIESQKDSLGDVIKEAIGRENVLINKLSEVRKMMEAEYQKHLLHRERYLENKKRLLKVLKASEIKIFR